MLLRVSEFLNRYRFAHFWTNERLDKLTFGQMNDWTNSLLDNDWTNKKNAKF